MKSTKSDIVRSKLTDISNLVVLILITLFTFHSITQFEILNWDDNQYILHNPKFQNQNQSFLTYFKGYDLGHYHPLTILSYAFDLRKGKPDAAALHRTNLIFHVSNVILLYILFRILSLNPIVALVGSLIFAVHPLRVEPVAWISSRKDLLATFFLLPTFIFYVLYIRNRKRVYLFVSILLFMAACLSKASSIAWAPVLTLYVFTFNRSYQVRRYWHQLPFYIIAFTTGIISYYAQQSAGATLAAPHFPLLWRILFAIYNLAIYSVQQLLSVSLKIYYLYPQPSHIHWLEIIGISLAFIAFFFTAWRFKNYYPYTFLLWSGIIVLLPVLQLVPAGNSMRADRYMYMTSLFWSGCLAVFLLSVPEKFKKIAVLFLMLYVTVNIYMTKERLHIWKNSESLWKQAITENPEWNIAYANLAHHYMETNKTDLSKEYYKKALHINPLHDASYVNLSLMYNTEKNYDSAYKYLSIGLKLFPEHPALNSNFGIYYLNMNIDSLAEFYFKKTLRYDSLSEGSYINLGFIFNKYGLPDSAYIYLQKGVALFPNNAVMLNNYAQTLFLLKRYNEALNVVNRSLELLPDNAYAWRNRALIYEALGEKEKCCADIARALQLNYTALWGDDLLQLQQKVCR